jgi:CRP-like cAMP-binding protein
MTLGPDEKRAWLAKVPLFTGCSDDVVEQLAAVSAGIGFAADHAIVQQSPVAHGPYNIVSGRARIVARSEELARFGPGDFIGELSVIDQRPRTASAYAIGPTTCLALASWDLVAVLEREPRLAMNLLKELAGRLRRADDQLRD